MESARDSGWEGVKKMKRFGTILAAAAAALFLFAGQPVQAASVTTAAEAKAAFASFLAGDPGEPLTIDLSTKHAREGIPGSTFSHGEKLTLPALWQRQQQGAAAAMQTTSVYGCSLNYAKIASADNGTPLLVLEFRSEDLTFHSTMSEWVISSRTDGLHAVQAFSCGGEHNLEDLYQNGYAAVTSDYYASGIFGSFWYALQADGRAKRLYQEGWAREEPMVSYVVSTFVPKKDASAAEAAVDSLVGNSGISYRTNLYYAKIGGTVFGSTGTGEDYSPQDASLQQAICQSLGFVYAEPAAMQQYEHDYAQGLGFSGFSGSCEDLPRNSADFTELASCRLR